MNENGDRPYRGLGYLSLFSDPIDLRFGNMEPKKIPIILQLSTCSIIQMGPYIINVGKKICLNR